MSPQIVSQFMIPYLHSWFYLILKYQRQYSSDLTDEETGVKKLHDQSMTTSPNGWTGIET